MERDDGVHMFSHAREKHRCGFGTKKSLPPHLPTIFPQALVCIFVTGLVCTAAYVGVYGVRHPLDIRVGIQVAALATVLLTVLRNALLQLKYQVGDG